MLLKTFKMFNFFSLLISEMLYKVPFSQHDPTAAAAGICTE